MRLLRTLLCVFILSYDYGYCQQPQVECYNSDDLLSIDMIKASLFGPGLKIDSFQIRGSVCKYSGLGNFMLGKSGVLLSTGNSETALLSPRDSLMSINNDDNDIATVILNLFKTEGTKYILDATIIEFDFNFENGCDGIFFNYVFASEEYPGDSPEFGPGYVCSNFNDKFAFYIAEKNDEDGYNNIATIPGTDISVAINSINGGKCSGTYNSENCNSCYLEEYKKLYTIDYNNMIFNGRTVPLSASVRLDPNKVYHAYIIVADFDDSAFDSGVFFKGKGIFGRKCPTISVQCEDGVSTLRVENGSNNDTIISYQWLKNGQPIVGGTGDTYIAQDDSIYSVNITYKDSSFINVIAPKRCCPTGGITINGDVTEGSLSVCKDKVLDIGYTNSNQMTNPQYQWTFTDVSETYTSPNFSITAEKTGTLKLKVTSEECANTIELTTEIHVDLCVGTVCNDCPSRFSPTPGEKYTLSGWVSAEDQIGDKDSFEKVYILLVFNLIGSDTLPSPQ